MRRVTYYSGCHSDPSSKVHATRYIEIHTNSILKATVTPPHHVQYGSSTYQRRVHVMNAVPDADFVSPDEN